MDFLFLYDSGLEDSICLGTYPFPPGCPLCWCIIVHTVLVSYDLLYFYGIYCNLSFISDFIYLFIFLGESSYRLMNFVYLFKEPAVGFINFFLLFFSLYFIYFYSDLFYFFLLLTLGFGFFEVTLGLNLDLRYFLKIV